MKYRKTIFDIIDNIDERNNEIYLKLFNEEMTMIDYKYIDKILLELNYLRDVIRIF